MASKIVADYAGVEFFSENLAKHMAELEEGIDHLPELNQTFARSLVEFYAVKEYLSPKQLPWAAAFWKFLNSISSEGEAVDERSNTRGTTPAELPVNCSKLLNLFNTAAQHGLAFPHMRFYAEGREQIDFKRAGETSKVPGAIWIVDNGSVIGVINPKTEQLDWSTEYHYEMKIQQWLKKLIEDAPLSFIMSGKAVGKCCFCARELTDPISVHHGYGQICSDKFGLPYVGESLESKLGVSL